MKSIILERGFIYPAAIAVLLIPYALIRIFEFFIKSNLLEFVSYAFYLISILHGFVSAIIFFSSQTVKKVIKNKNNFIFASMGIEDQDEFTLKISFRSTVN